ncbi:MAG: hypothetical protein JST00_25135 [Deltaproteobacteria bacterium]|nr:hypothetical protein [Deltaproteobacteria bacterium]
MQTTTIVPKVADRIGRAFPQRALLLGIEWFRSGGVEVESLTDDAVSAAVKGKRTQRVRLATDAAGRALATACSCHASSLGAAVCSHVWALVLEVDRRGALASLRTSHGAARVVPMPDDPVTSPAEPGEGSARRRARRSPRKSG